MNELIPKHLGLVLVLVTAWLFLGTRIAIFTSLGIPFSLAGTFLVLLAIGETLNVTVLLGVVIVLGMLVDDAVVIVEAMYYRLQRGTDAVTAAIESFREVGLPMLSAVLTTLAAFLPLMLLPGILGDFMRVIPMVVSIALAISLLEAFWILPAHVIAMRVSFANPSRLHRWRTRFTHALQIRYLRTLLKVLRWPRLSLGALLLMFAVASAPWSRASCGLLGAGLVQLAQAAEQSLDGMAGLLRRHGYPCWVVASPRPDFPPPRLHSLSISATAVVFDCEGERRVQLPRGAAAVGVLADLSGELPTRQAQRLLAQHAYLGRNQATIFSPDELRQAILKGQPVFDCYLLDASGAVAAAFRVFPGRFDAEGLGGRASLSAVRNLEAVVALVGEYAGDFKLYCDFGLSPLPGCQPQPAREDPQALLGNLDALTRYGWLVASLAEPPAPLREELVATVLGFFAPALEMALTPFLRYEGLNLHWQVPTGGTANPALDQRTWTAGLGYKPIPMVVVKADYQYTSTAAGGPALQQANLGLGLVY